MNKRLSATLKWTGIFILALGILYVALLGLGNYKLRQAYAALEADGRPMKPEQVIPPPISDTDNAAFVYKAAVLQLMAERSDKENVSLLELITQITFNMHIHTNAAPQAMEALRKLTHQKVVVEVLQELEVGTAKSGCCFFTDSQHVILKENLGTGLQQTLHPPNLSYSGIIHRGGDTYSYLFALTKFLGSIACAQAADGDFAAAWKTAMINLRVANSLTNDPLLTSQLVRMSQIQIVMRTMQHLCDNEPITSKHMKQVDELLQSFDDRSCLSRALDGERLLFGEPYFKRPIAEIWQHKIPKEEMPEMNICHDLFTLAFNVIYMPFRSFDHATYLRLTHAATKRAEAVPIVENSILEDSMTKELPWYCIQTRAILPALSSVINQYGKTLATVRTTRAGLTAILYRQEQGHYPETLAAIHMDTLLDPFSGKALIYRANPHGFIVYSVGPNLRDDGGESIWNSMPKKDDIAWKYSEPAEAKAASTNSVPAGAAANL